MRLLLRGQVETAGEVRVEDVEAAGPEPELDRTRVHEHGVPLLDRAR